MANLKAKSFDEPDERRTDSCQNRHIGTATGGQLHVVHDDGTEADWRPSPASATAPSPKG